MLEAKRSRAVAALAATVIAGCLALSSLALSPDPAHAAAKSLSSSKAKVTLAKQETYTGKAIKTAITVKYKGKKLKKNRDFKVTYKSNKAIGTAKVTVKGIGKYKGMKTKTFKIVPRAVSSVHVSYDSSSAKVDWTPLASQASGYEARLARTSSMSGAIVVSTKGAASATFKVSPSTRYWIQVRAFKVVGGKKYFSAWTRTLAFTSTAAPSSWHWSSGTKPGTGEDGSSQDPSESGSSGTGTPQTPSTPGSGEGNTPQGPSEPVSGPDAPENGQGGASDDPSSPEGSQECSHAWYKSVADRFETVIDKPAWTEPASGRTYIDCKCGARFFGDDEESLHAGAWLDHWNEWAYAELAAGKTVEEIESLEMDGPHGYHTTLKYEHPAVYHPEESHINRIPGTMTCSKCGATKQAD